MINKPPFWVCVHSSTYNHHAFITDAMNGFSIQKTNFPFVCVIIDDNSTDDTRDVIKRYLNDNFTLLDSDETETQTTNFAQHNTNKNCYFAAIFLKQNHESQKKSKNKYYEQWQRDAKYVAMCEGDDYWLTENKLQTQVDFLEANGDYTMIFHSARVINENNIKCSLQCENIEERDYSPTELFEHWIVPTASILIRKDIYNQPINNPSGWAMNDDIIIVEKAAHNGKVRGINPQLAAYRVHSGGVTYNVAMQKSRTYGYPAHYLMIRKNFKQIDLHVINRFIISSYFGCFKIDKKPKWIWKGICISPWIFVELTFKKLFKDK